MLKFIYQILCHIFLQKNSIPIEKISFFTTLINKTMKSYPQSLLFICIVFAFTSCKTKNEMQKDLATDNVSGPNVMIYKTSADYFMHVPVTLSQDKKSILSYPAPGDVFFNGDLAYPVKLEDGFLLDRRGITVNSGFLSWTYYEYSRFETTPSPDELMKKMLEVDPFTIIYDCGKISKYRDLEKELNEKIRNRAFTDFKRIK